MTFLEKLHSGFVILDGGMGTELQRAGLPAGTLPECWNLINPQAVTDIHAAYLAAGSDVIAANTFGANPLKFSEDTEQVITAAVHCAQAAVAAAGGDRPRFVALDVGPLGRLLCPLGDLAFDTAVSLFARMMRAGAKAGADLIMIETMNDAYETKAAVLAAKESCDLPILVSNVYDETAKLMTGADPAAMVALLEGLRVDALGLNCSLGPQEMLPAVRELLAHASIPVIVKPNAGLPTVQDGRTVYSVDAAEFSEQMREIAGMGAVLLGGCCGTTPDYIRALRCAVENVPFTPPILKNETVISSYTHAISFGQAPVLIGERINPTGKKRFKQALIERDIPYILNEGIKQADAGAQALDVNVGLPGIDEAALMQTVVCELQAVTDLPLQIDTSLPDALEKGLRYYNGKPLINSVNGKPESMQAVFPLAKKYGGVVVALTLDEQGIPATAEGRVAIAARILSVAAEYGIAAKNIIIDPLAMAVSADRTAGNVALQTVALLHQRGIRTTMGVSNISFGLPCRDFITSTFFALALQSGLDAAIMNPYSPEMMKVYHSYRALTGRDVGCKQYIAFAGQIGQQTAGTFPVKATLEDNNGTPGLYQSIVKGLKQPAGAQTADLLLNTPPMDIINTYIIPALDEVGRGFEQKTVYLPQLLMSAEAATTAFEVVRQSMPKQQGSAEKIILATVRGDIHDIGKNIVRVLLENYGFSVIDLGRDVPCEKILAAVKQWSASLVGLSALMTTTVPAMAETIRLLQENGYTGKIVVGGAVLTPEYAKTIGADFYAKNAMETVRIAETCFGRAPGNRLQTN